MKISKKEDYAVLLMCALSQNERPWVSLDAVAKRYHLPLPFLQQIARNLKRAGLLNSREGAAGGYALTREPKDIALADVLEAMSGKLKLTQCTTNIACPIEAHCVTRAPWQKLHSVVQNVFRGISLADLKNSKLQPSSLREPTAVGSWQSRFHGIASSLDSSQ